MIHAFTRNKTNLKNRYNRYNDDPDEHKRTQEDEITAMLIGPLDFLAFEDSAAFWSALIRLHDPEHGMPNTPPYDVTMTFWPKLNREPDLRVDLAWPGDARILLIEFKWLSPLSEQDQLQKQWEECLTEDEQKRATHIFIGLDTNEAANALKKQNIWGDKLLIRSWFDVVTAIANLKIASTTPLGRWGEHVSNFLKLHGVVAFSGFDGLTPPVLLPSNTVYFAHAEQ